MKMAFPDIPILFYILTSLCQTYSIPFRILTGFEPPILSHSVLFPIPEEGWQPIPFRNIIFFLGVAKLRTCFFGGQQEEIILHDQYGPRGEQHHGRFVSTTNAALYQARHTMIRCTVFTT